MGAVDDDRTVDYIRCHRWTVTPLCDILLSCSAFVIIFVHTVIKTVDILLKELHDS